MNDHKRGESNMSGFRGRGAAKAAAATLLILFASGAAYGNGTGETGGSRTAEARGLTVQGPQSAGTEVVALGAEDVKALDSLIARHYEDSMQVAFGTFTYEYTGLPSSFSRYLEEALASLIARSDRYRLLTRNVAAAMDPAFREQYKDFFQTNLVGGLLSGRFFDEGDRVRVRIELTNLKDGNLVGSGDLVRAKKDLPPRLSIEPLKETQATAASVVRLLPETAPAAPAAQAAPARPAQAAPAVPAAPSPAPAALPVVKWTYQSSVGGLAVAVSTDRGAGACYQDGELMTVYVTASKAAYVKVYHIDVRDTVQLIWPNRFGGTGMVKPGVPVPIPADGDPFEFLLGEPYGTEFIKVVASTEPWERTEADFSDLGTDARGVVSRGLEVKASSASVPSAKAASAARSAGERAEALASYYIGPKVTTVFQ